MSVSTRGQVEQHGGRSVWLVIRPGAIPGVVVRACVILFHRASIPSFMRVWCEGVR
jgi:hypothetical protein